MGTPEFAVPSLRALVEAGHDLCGVFTQPDRPKNRGMRLQPTPVKEYAMSKEIPVYQPATLKDGTALAQIKALAPELIVVAAYGRILPKELLDCPPLGCVNVHSSLLPKYRGAAPINWAVIHGEAETGVTIMHMAPELDAGDIILQQSTPIGPDETAAQLHDRLACIGGELIAKAVSMLADGTAPRHPQDPSKATYAPMLSRELSPIDWTKSAKEIHDQVRGLIPWPATTTQVIGGRTVKIFSTAVAGRTVSAAPGTILAAGGEGIDIACGGGTVLRVLELQAEGKRRMTAAEYLRGNPVAITG